TRRLVMRRRRLALHGTTPALLLLLGGCASSIMIHPEDSATLKTVKVAARVAEAIPTLGLVEVYYACARDVCSGLRGACDAQRGARRDGTHAGERPSSPPRCRGCSPPARAPHRGASTQPRTSRRRRAHI